MSNTYVPCRGDIVWLQFSPQTGNRQSGKRPAYVISPRQYNSKVKLGLFCPVTSRIKGYPFEVHIPENNKIEGVILVDQIKSLDWQARQAELIYKLPDQIFEEVNAKLKALID